MRILIHRPAVALATLSALGLAACGSPDSASSRPTITISPVGQNTTPTQPTQNPAPVLPPALPPATAVTPIAPPAITPTTPDATGVTPVVLPTTVTPTTTTPAITPTPIPPAPVPPAPTAEEPDEPVAACSGEGDPGIPQTETGWFPANSNKSCFQGSWYCFDDGEVTTSCVKDTPPWDAAESSMCLTGSTIVDSTYKAWGAGIGASLNDQDGDKELFDADAAGIVGFKFTVSGTLGDAVLKFKVPRSTKDSDSPPEYVVKVGSNSVEFSDLEPPDWDEVGDKLDPAELTELKWQIAGGDVEAEYNFCISNLEPIYD